MAFWPSRTKRGLKGKKRKFVYTLIYAYMHTHHIHVHVHYHIHRLILASFANAQRESSVLWVLLLGVVHCHVLVARTLP